MLVGNAQKCNLRIDVKNSVIIQNELALIQNVMAKLWQSSDMNFLVRQEITIEMISVGIIITMPNSGMPKHQAISLKSQNTLCKFSIFRY